jgi:hypothetical protein
MEKLSEHLQVKITPSLARELETAAERMRLRVPDVVRFALSKGLDALDADSGREEPKQP